VISLIPDEYVNPNPIPQAVDKCVSEYESGNLTVSKFAIVDFLTRAKPRIKGHEKGLIVTSHDPEEQLQQIIPAITNLDDSYLTIQGPLGAGKSYTGKHVIAELVTSGARVGIASNSHKAINNLLLSTAKYCKQKNISATY